ncbi:MAG: hypothetical protein ACKOCB_03275 [Planctomycetia bacterium]
MAVGWTLHKAGTANRTRDETKELKTDLPALHVLVRETVQNSLDAWARELGAKRVTVRFRLRTLSGQDKRSFLEALQGEDYRKRARQSMLYEQRIAREAGGNRPNPPVIKDANLAALDPAKLATPLRLLLIEDYGATGLTGSELDNAVSSRFSACCRDAEFSVKQHYEAGGSYGKGKNVLWLHAGSRLVLFFSHLSEPFKGHAERFFGVGKLPWHADTDEVSERYTGRCDLGTEDEGYSVLGSPARTLAKKLGLGRDAAGGTGTSICLVDFDARFGDEGGNAAGEIARALELYYWPAIRAGRLECFVHDEDNDRTYEMFEDPRPELQPYIEAYDLAVSRDAERSRQTLVQVPARQDVAPQCEAPVVLACAPVAQSDVRSQPPTDAVALIRGFGMVVNYKPVRPARLNAVPYAGVVLAGAAVPQGNAPRRGGERTPAQMLESLLAYAEPEAHDMWTPKLLRGSGWRGAGPALDRLLAWISEQVTELAGGGKAPRDGKALAELSKRFRLGGTSTGSSARTMSITQAAEPEVLRDTRIRFKVRIQPLEPTKPPPLAIEVGIAATLLDAVSGRRARAEEVRVATVRAGADELARQGDRDATAKAWHGHVSMQGRGFPLELEVTTVPLGEAHAERAHYGLDVRVNPTSTKPARPEAK